jgi:hypothetical protein
MGKPNKSSTLQRMSLNTLIIEECTRYSVQHCEYFGAGGGGRVGGKKTFKLRRTFSQLHVTNISVFIIKVPTSLHSRNYLKGNITEDLQKIHVSPTYKNHFYFGFEILTAVITKCAIFYVTLEPRRLYPSPLLFTYE